LNAYIPSRKASVVNSFNDGRGQEFNSCIDNQLQGLAANVGMQYMLETMKKTKSFDEGEQIVEEEK
jgi:hypothetical protein